MNEILVLVMQNGHYQIIETDIGVYLSVYPPLNGGSMVEEDVIFQDIAERGITILNRGIISKAVIESSGQPVQIANSLSLQIVPDIHIMVRRDRLEAMVSVTTPPNSLGVTMLQLLDKLKSANVVYGIDEKALEWLMKARSSVNICCARAQLPRDGDPAFFKYHIDIESQGRPVEMADGSVDFKNINNFITVEEGQLLMEKVPPTLGILGIDVLGLPIPAKPGKDIRMVVGKNTMIVDNSLLVATIHGQIHIARNRINVLPTIEIAADVDYSTGNIDFVGNVIVHGSVQSGFSIKAGGNVEIRGTICGGMVEANNIIIRMGIQGMNRSVIKARERVVTKFIENATVYADQDVVVNDVILHSSVFAGSRVIADSQRGLVIGGRISAGEGIRISTVGNQAHINTLLEISANPFLKDELRDLQDENKKINLLSEDLKCSLAYIRKQGVENLTTKKRERYDKMEAEYNALPERVEEILQRITDIESILSSLKPGKISVSNVIYPGVKVSLGSLTRVINDSLKYLSLYAHEGEIKFSSFQ